VLGPEDLEKDVAVINRCVQRRQMEKLMREAQKLDYSGAERG